MDNPHLIPRTAGGDVKSLLEEFLISQGRLVAANVTGVIITGSGHWLIEEAPEQTIPALVSFINTPVR